MTLPSFGLLCGAAAALLFVSSHVPMLARALRTKDLRSYSRSYLVLSNLGNLCYWVYVGTLPLGPIWLMHAFYTVTAALMLVWYFQHAAPQRSAPQKRVGGREHASRIPEA